jgi:hypothetical protein
MFSGKNFLFDSYIKQLEFESHLCIRYKLQIRFFLILTLFLSPYLAKSSTLKDTCLTGLYLKNIYDLHPEEYAYTADFWIWFDHKGQIFDPLKNVEIINAKQVTLSDQYHANADHDMFLASESNRTTLIHNWKLGNYPFDKQSFHIELEAGLDTTKMILKPLPGGFKIYKGLILPGWQILSSQTKESLITYESDFGERNLHGKSTFSRITYILTIKRNGWGLFFKLLLGLYVSFFVSFLVFFLPPTSDQRFGLSIGGLFAAIANKYITDNNIPSSTSFSFVDQVHVLTFVYILITLVLSLVSMKIINGKSHQHRIKFDRLWALIILCTYVLFNAGLIINAYFG